MSDLHSCNILTAFPVLENTQLRHNSQVTYPTKASGLLGRGWELSQVRRALVESMLLLPLLYNYHCLNLIKQLVNKRSLRQF